MAKITSDQIHALYGEFDDKWRKKLNLPFSEKKKIVKEWKADMYRGIIKWDIQNMTNDQLKDMFLQYSKVSDDFTNEMIKEDIEDIFSDPNSVASLRQMLIDNQWNVNHILVWYKKLAKVKKIEKEIEKWENQINEIKLKLYIQQKSLQTADRTIISRVQKIQQKIEEKKKEKEKLLQTKEVVAAYELQKIAGYADRLNQWKLVYTPSVEKNKEDVRNSVFTWQNILLTWPVGTWKTRLAIDIYKEILEEKKRNGEIDDAAYQKLSQLCMVNGNEDTSIRDIKSRPIQMSNKQWEEKVFTYDEWLLTLCLKYWMPLIIDEANRTSPNFLSSLKKFRALKPWQEYKDEVTWETFKIKAPLQVILTSNEWQKYGKHTTEFQDQIERELERVYVWYMPENELYDLAKAKLYETPWIANITESDLQETLPHLINAVTEINDLYTSWKEYSAAGSTSDMRLSFTVLDTKRFLQLLDREIIGSKETFWDELNQKIVEFIQWIKPSDAWDMDRKILCIIFHKNGLLCKENIPDLVRWAAKLTAYDLSTIVSSSKSQLKIPRWNRFVNPWQFAKWYGSLTNREWDVARHRLANFENLDFEDKGTKLKSLSKSLRALWVLNPMEHGQLISKLNNMDENNLQEILGEVAGIVLSDHKEKLSDLGKIIDEADEIVHGVKGKIQNKMLEKMWVWKAEDGREWDAENSREWDAEDGREWDAENSREWDAEDGREFEAGEIPQELKDFREKWEQEIDLDNDTKNAIINAVNKIPHRAKIEKDGSRLVEFELWWKNYKCLDVNLIEHSDKEYLQSYEYNWQTNDGVELWWMRWDDTKGRENKKLADYVDEQRNMRWMEIPKIEFQRDLINKLWETAGLTGERDKIAMWMYLTWNYGYYWLSMWDNEHSDSQASSRSSLICRDDYRRFYYFRFDPSSASLCLIACS